MAGGAENLNTGVRRGDVVEVDGFYEFKSKTVSEPIGQGQHCLAQQGLGRTMLAASMDTRPFRPRALQPLS